jgi:hypothetical protein
VTPTCRMICRSMALRTECDGVIAAHCGNGRGTLPQGATSGRENCRIVAQRSVCQRARGRERGVTAPRCVGVVLEGTALRTLSSGRGAAHDAGTKLDRRTREQGRLSRPVATLVLLSSHSRWETRRHHAANLIASG